MGREHDNLQSACEGKGPDHPSTAQTCDDVRLSVVFVFLERVYNKPAYDQVEPPAPHKGATPSCKVGMSDVCQDVYEEKDIDDTFQTMSRSRMNSFFLGLPHTMAHTIVYYIFGTSNDDAIAMWESLCILSSLSALYRVKFTRMVHTVSTS